MNPANSDHEISSKDQPLLDVKGLTLRYALSDGSKVSVLENVDFHVTAGETVGLLGESGAGKSTIAWALLGLLPKSAEISSGTILFHNRDIARLSERELRGIRGAEIALIPQDPALALNPVVTIGQQLRDIVRAHTSINREEARARAWAALHEVGLTPVERIYSAYPHQLSGGQRQRVVIAQALVCEPELLIADEATSSLDQITQAQVLALLKTLRKKHGFALLLISHDPFVVGEMADRMVVLHDGRVVDSGTTEALFASPHDSYTRSLLSCVEEQADVE